MSRITIATPVSDTAIAVAHTITTSAPLGLATRAPSYLAATSASVFTVVETGVLVAPNGSVAVTVIL